MSSSYNNPPYKPYLGEKGQIDEPIPVTFGKSAKFLPQDNYIKNVVPPPELIYEDEISYVARYYLFAETFIKPRVLDLDENEAIQVSLISRSHYQPAGVEKNKKLEDFSFSEKDLENYYNQLFFWNLFWLPVNCQPNIKISTPIDSDSQIPYKILTEKQELSDYWVNLEHPKINFVLKKGSDKSPVVLRVTNPIFDVTVKK